MKLVNILSKVVQNQMVNEALSPKVIDQLIKKFENQTKDPVDTQKQIIQAFDKYKDGLPADKRDITKYNYSDLKNLILTKEMKKEEKKVFGQFQKENAKQVDKDLVKKALKKFYEIFPLIPGNQRDVMSYSYLQLEDFLRKNFITLLTKAATAKFKSEYPEVTPEQLLFYIGTFLDNYDQLPLDTPYLLFMNFNQLEGVVDSLGGISVSTGKKDDFEDIETVYDQDNLLIFKPSGKEQCIRLAHGRPWCISRTGGSNLYYNYRLGDNLTIYYVIDKDKDYSDVDFASVILVTPYGQKRLADGKNMSGGYSGHRNESWSTISSKIPKIADKEHLFVADPLSDDEQETMRYYKNVSVNSDAVEELGGVDKAELWMEIRSPDLTSKPEIFKNLPTELQRKYVSLGYDLTPDMINNSKEGILTYYSGRKLDELKRKSLNDLSQADIALLKTPMMEAVKNELKPNFKSQLPGQTNDTGVIQVIYPKDVASKYIALYEFEDFFETIPENVSFLAFNNPTDQVIAYDIPESLSRLKSLQVFTASNYIKSLPESLGQLENISFLNLNDNPQLNRLPDSIVKCTCLQYVNIDATCEIPQSAQKYLKKGSGGFVEVDFPEEMTKNCQFSIKK